MAEDHTSGGSEPGKIETVLAVIGENLVHDVAAKGFYPNKPDRQVIGNVLCNRKKIQYCLFFRSKRGKF